MMIHTHTHTHTHTRKKDIYNTLIMENSVIIYHGTHHGKVDTLIMEYISIIEKSWKIMECYGKCADIIK